ncbi:ABC transporter ATP-binding protein [Thalassotalea atypica]|uniref:ABC transporter ATP-binding protein n=1 Tax=Thalassotalea atypica TaxID=2054316 RepID=UPI002573B8DF|nr:ABC transporter ATP-binding protein [Thalassotalea atypica]
MTQLLEIEQLSVALDGNNILSDINLTLNAGEIMGLVGASGCGKTTLLNTLAGFVRFERGRISLGNKIVIDQNQFVEPEHRHIGMIFQDYALFPHLTVQENVAFGIKRLAKDIQSERVEQLLTLLKLSEYANRYPHQLSGGQQQRVAIARALAPQPKLLLLDEPFSNIDARLRHELMLEIRRLLKQLGISAIFVTHNKDEVFTFADKMAVMNEGQLLQVGAPTELCQNPKSWLVADFLQLGSWVPCKIATSHVKTALGEFDFNDDKDHSVESLAKLLIKPQHLSLDDDKPVNAEVVHIGVTEQGFHYHIDSIDSIDGDPQLKFSQLSLYSESVYQLGQQLTVSLKPHKLLVFNQQVTHSEM